MDKNNAFMRVCVSEPIPEATVDLLRKYVEVTFDTAHPEELDGIIIRRFPVDRDFIEKAVKLKVICVHGVGTDSIDLEAAAERGIQVRNAPGQNAESVAQMALCGILALARNVKKANTGISQGRYSEYAHYDFVSYELTGKTLGLVGSGRIALALARMMKAAFQVQVLAYNPHRSHKELAAMELEKADTVEELFRRSDFVSVHVPLTAETKNLISDPAFDAAKPELILVNTARGGVVDEDALYRALREGKIHGAFSDVFTSEPPGKENPLVYLENFIATPHVGGNTVEGLARVGHVTVKNCLEALGII